jgi:hypothetical protein
MAEDLELASLEAVAEKLIRRFDGRVPRHVVEQELFDSYRRIAANSRVPSFLPLLAERSAVERLRERASVG